MLRIIAIFSLLLNTASSQPMPVKWQFTTIKTAANTYEVHLKARINKPWHIYSQFTPDGGPVATRVSIAKNPLLQLESKVKEQGHLQTKYEDVFGIDVKYFNDSADFVQTIKLKKPVKTNVTGTIHFMACNDEQCLPPETVSFNILLQ